MKRIFYIGMVIILILALCLVGYGAYLNKVGEHVIAERTENRRLPVTGAKVERRELKPILELDTANLYSDEMIDAVAMIDGRITSAFVTKNSHVSAGQTLFAITNDQLPLKIQQADASIVKAEAGLAQATNSYHRYGRLMAKNATSREKYEEAEANFNAAQASLAAARAEKDQLEVMYSYRNVTAPIDGEVLIMYRQPGAYVQTGTPLALIGKFQTLYFALDFEDSVVKRLLNSPTVSVRFHDNKIQKAYGTDFAAGNLGDEQRFTATVRDIAPAISEPAAMRRVLWAIDNSQRLLEPQTYSGVVLESPRSYQCLAVPLKAMVDAGRDSVYVLQPDNTIKQQYVVTGADDGTFIEIISGLNLGDTVITSKPNGFEDGMPVEVTLDTAGANTEGAKINGR